MRERATQELKIRIRPTLKRSLDEFADSTELPVSAVVRRFIREGLKREKAKEMA